MCLLLVDGFYLKDSRASCEGKITDIKHLFETRINLNLWGRSNLVSLTSLKITQDLMSFQSIQQRRMADTRCIVSYGIDPNLCSATYSRNGVKSFGMRYLKFAFNISEYPPNMVVGFVKHYSKLGLNQKSNPGPEKKIPIMPHGKHFLTHTWRTGLLWHGFFMTQGVAEWHSERV